VNSQTYKKKREFHIFLYLYMLLILFLLLTVASYTWFSLTATPRVSDLNMYVATTNGLQLAIDPTQDDWVLQLDFVEIVDETAPLRPVTWSNENQQFFAAVYGMDGRLTGQWEPLTDRRNANKNNLDGYYTLCTFYGRTGTNCRVSLSPAVEVDDGIDGSGTYLIGTPVWNQETVSHENGGQGAETAIRVGIRITPVDGQGEELEDREPLFYIYEPNADLHISQEAGYVVTRSIDSLLDDTQDAVQSDEEDPVPLVPEEQMIIQTASTWTEAYPVERTVVIKDLGEFTTDTKLIDMSAGEMVRFDVYIWLEGQDIDCTNQINQAQILANLQFTAETDGQSGLVPIE